MRRIVHQPVELLHAPRFHLQHQVDAGGEQVPHVVGHDGIVRHDREGVHLLLRHDIERRRAFVRQLVEGIELRAAGIMSPLPLPRLTSK